MLLCFADHTAQHMPAKHNSFKILGVCNIDTTLRKELSLELKSVVLNIDVFNLLKEMESARWTIFWSKWYVRNTGRQSTESQG